MYLWEKINLLIRRPKCCHQYLPDEIVKESRLPIPDDRLHSLFQTEAGSYARMFAGSTAHQFDKWNRAIGASGEKLCV